MERKTKKKHLLENISELDLIAFAAVSVKQLKSKITTLMEKNLHLKLRSRTFGNLDSSSIKAIIFNCLIAIKSKASWLSTNSMCCQFMCSWLYSSCSSLKICLTKNCCKFSLA